MTKEEAIKTIKEAMYFIDGLGARVISSKMAEALAALETCTVEPSKSARPEAGSHATQLDENGLMPCGCGGKAHVYLPVSVYSLYIIGCERCRVRITFLNKVNEAKNEWNTAMGYKEADK